MAIVLSRELEEQIEEIVRTGDFASAEEFVRHSVEKYGRARQIAELARREDIQRMLEEGLRDLQEGRYSDYDDEGLKAFFEQVKREGRIAMGLSPDAT